MTTPTPDLPTILRSIVSWSRDEQVRLARAILDQLALQTNGSGSPTDSTPLPPSSSFVALYGLAAGDGTPPSDEQVAEWLDERRMRHLDEADSQDARDER
jgi:hypothetical protein